ncbi:copper resistance CopC family protein [Methylosarcina fibrata]|uniref:copper resistance CopC family protein n=1 Tax=Methylosarcina fibrata TaxID=105972 RepID=UPI00036E37D6|nr:copper resistance CopC family protein [Methylosarcina fibrata]
MKQLFRFGLLWLTLTQIPHALAHAVVTDYSLKIKPIRALQKDTVELMFNSKIELGLSQVFLVRKGDVHETLPISKGARQGQMIIAVPPLEAGDYAIKLKVFAADGHLTEDVIHFSVSQ